MCYARSPVASFLAYKAFIDKRVLKYYLALVHGHVYAPYPIFVDVPIGENASCYGRIMCTNDHPHCTSPKAAQSHVDVLEHGEYDGNSIESIGSNINRQTTSDSFTYELFGSSNYW